MTTIQTVVREPSSPRVFTPCACCDALVDTPSLGAVGMFARGYALCLAAELTGEPPELCDDCGQALTEALKAARIAERVDALASES